MCRDCRARFAAPGARCLQCAIEVPVGVARCGACIRQPPPHETAVVALPYAYPWDRLIAGFKFRGRLDLAPVFSAVLSDAVGSRQAAVDWIVPVPLSATRLRERGYNQAWELARRLRRPMHARPDAALVQRTRDTPHQAMLPRGQRAANVRDAFRLAPGRENDVAGATVALVDDVMTTGATVGELAAMLRRAGAAQVHVWALARTPFDAVDVQHRPG